MILFFYLMTLKKRTYVIVDLVYNWLVVSTHLKNFSQSGNLPQIGVKKKHVWNHHLDNVYIESWSIWDWGDEDQTRHN